MKFTEREIEMLKEMIDFPSSYKLTEFGVSTITSILKKAEIINNQ
jgi:hypothetical protein